MSFAEKLQSLQEQMQGFDINELSIDNIGSWPLPIKLVCWVVVFVALIAGGVHLIITDLQNEKVAAENKEQQLKKDFENKAYQAANLNAYRQQMEDMESSFGALISQLPSDTEVPGLLEDITNKGVGSGLTFKEIKLQSERTHEFYIELPINIVVVGTYHDMGAFVSGVASLPRIVTLKDFSIRPQGGRRDNSNLEMRITASTYRYREMAQGKKAAPSKGRKK
ncbi:MAG TPA: type 4a pilus biogenesis protein PilO [Pseudomonadales bacterium]